MLVGVVAVLGVVVVVEVPAGIVDVEVEVEP